jgi:hypothetical protein
MDKNIGFSNGQIETIAGGEASSLIASYEYEQLMFNIRNGLGTVLYMSCALSRQPIAKVRNGHVPMTLGMVLEINIPI